MMQSRCCIPFNKYLKCHERLFQISKQIDALHIQQNSEIALRAITLLGAIYKSILTTMRYTEDFRLQVVFMTYITSAVL